MKVRCDRLRGRLPAVLDDPDALEPAEQEHLASCLRCQADLARHRRIQRAVSALADDPIPLDPAGPDPLLVRLDERIAARRRRQAAVVRSTAGVAALAAVGAVVIGLAGRRRSA